MPMNYFVHSRQSTLNNCKTYSVSDFNWLTCEICHFHMKSNRISVIYLPNSRYLFVVDNNTYAYFILGDFTRSKTILNANIPNMHYKIECCRIKTTYLTVADQSQTKFGYCVQNGTRPLRITCASFVFNAKTEFYFALVGDADISCFYSTAFKYPFKLQKKT